MRSVYLAWLPLLPGRHCHHDCYQHGVSISEHVRVCVHLAPPPCVVPAAMAVAPRPRYLLSSTSAFAPATQPASHADSAYCYCLSQGRLNIVIIKEKSYFVKGQCCLGQYVLMTFPLTRVMSCMFYYLKKDTDTLMNV